uniref:Elongation of very long chain fatty acids protein n=1 Tax=Phallusia mammillata TaxID=59560 RepID=A0A6F9DCF8_9ASCI|nr:elongation of very long chain fatty acids protein 7-like [Phallusia mammillata]
MAELLNRFGKVLNETLEQADPRVSEYPFMDRPGLNLIGTLTYLFVVTYAGPRYMKNREPFNLRKFVAVYNLVMVIFSTYIFYEFLASGWFNDYSFTCQECDYSNSAKALRMVRVCYLFWISKYIEFLDTIFFIAHKKFQHVSFLHVFHHSLMAFTWWWGVKFSPGGLGTFHALINAFVHMVMYSYYGIAAMGPKYQKYIWWKKYLTVFQMTQFVVVFGHMVNVTAFYDCKYPQAFKYIIASYGTMFFILFSNFWIQAYTKRSRRRAADTKEKASSSSYTNGNHMQNGVSNGVHKRAVANGTSKQD